MKESQERQLKMLNRIYETCMPPRPVFKPHHDLVPNEMVPYISFADLYEYKFNVRVVHLGEYIVNNEERMENGKIVASYNSMQELVADGWVLD